MQDTTGTAAQKYRHLTECFIRLACVPECPEAQRCQAATDAKIAANKAREATR